MNETRICRSLAETKTLAKHFAEVLKQGKGATVLFESAPMGAGKTTFVKAVVSALNPKALPPTSPTFTIINQYAENIFHIDLYRIESEQELLNTDFHEITSAENYVFIEWSSIVNHTFRGRVFRISIEPLTNTSRKFTIKEDLL